tara:strand:+ start:146 stop:646 length:501 start_codon:yes stop_codon:yes gene_type:complete
MVDLNRKYCHWCGTILTVKKLNEIDKHYCNTCNRFIFEDPKLAVVVLVSNGSKLLLVKRAIEPALGKWSFPSGYVDLGEAVETAAVREVKEETGVDIKINFLVGAYSSSLRPLVLLAYGAEVSGGIMKLNHEVLDLGYFSPECLPDMPFPHDDEILRDWTALYGLN